MRVYFSNSGLALKNRCIVMDGYEREGRRDVLILLPQLFYQL